MTDDFEIIEKSIGHAIEIEENAPAWRMPATFGRDYQRIAEYLNTHGAEILDFPYARYQDMDWGVELNRGKLATFFSLFTKKWHFFVGMPSSVALPGKDDLKSITHGSQRYVRGVHRGPYKDCSGTYKALFSWAQDKGLALKNEAIECYVNDPREVDEADIETVILIPLA
jgi:effector-binding domain-containing protein